MKNGELYLTETPKPSVFIKKIEGHKISIDEQRLPFWKKLGYSGHQ